MARALDPSRRQPCALSRPVACAPHRLFIRPLVHVGHALHPPHTLSVACAPCATYASLRPLLHVGHARGAHPAAAAGQGGPLRPDHRRQHGLSEVFSGAHCDTFPPRCQGATSRPQHAPRGGPISTRPSSSPRTSCESFSAQRARRGRSCTNPSGAPRARTPTEPCTSSRASS